MSLHEQIMDLPVCGYSAQMAGASHLRAYELGHRDCRHAAAELAVKQDALVGQLFEALKYARRMVAPSECDVAYIDAALAAARGEVGG